MLAFYFFFSYFLGGERDIVFRLVIVLLLLLFDRGYYTGFRLFSFFAFVVLITPITQTLKAVLLTGNLDLFIGGFWHDLLYGEFISSSRNLEYILINKSNVDVDSVISKEIWGFLGYGGNAVSWFNSVFRDEIGMMTSSGWGFSLIGTFYLAGGFFGVLASYFVFGVLFSMLNNLRKKNVYYYSIYVCLIPVFIYCQRADFANFLSLSIKYILIPVLILFIIRGVVGNNKTYGGFKQYGC
jgi:hypothetical protein